MQVNFIQVYGGSVYEGMADLIHIMSNLADVEGNILIPGVNDKVKPVSLFYFTSDRVIFYTLDFQVINLSILSTRSFM